MSKAVTEENKNNLSNEEIEERLHNESTKIKKYIRKNNKENIKKLLNRVIEKKN